MIARSCAFVAVLTLGLPLRPVTADEKKPAEPVTRNRVQLNLAGAEMIVAASTVVKIALLTIRLRRSSNRTSSSIRS